MKNPWVIKTYQAKNLCRHLTKMETIQYIRMILVKIVI